MPDERDRARNGLVEDLHVAFARFEGSVTSELKNLSHDVKNLVTSLASYATNRDLKAAEDRIEKLEKNQTWISRTIIGTVVLAMLGAVVAGIKLGAHP